MVDRIAAFIDRLNADQSSSLMVSTLILLIGLGSRQRPVTILDLALKTGANVNSTRFNVHSIPSILARLNAPFTLRWRWLAKSERKARGLSPYAQPQAFYYVPTQQQTHA